MTQTDLAGTTRGVRLMYLILLGAAVLVAIAFMVMVQLRGPILVRDSGTEVIAWSFSGIGVTAVAFGVLLVRPRIPPRAPEESIDGYWGGTSVARARSMLLWIIAENAGMVSALGYLLTGHLAPLAALALALAVLAWFNPSRIASSESTRRETR